MSWKHFTLWLNLTAFLALLLGLAAVFLWPEQLAAAGLSRREGTVVLMQLISLMLLCGGFQRNLETGWRRAALVGSFVVLSQSTLLTLLPVLRP